MKLATSTIIALAALALVATAPSATTPRTTRISVSSARHQGDRPSWTGGISANGRYVAFTSQATNLVPADTNNRQDAFVYDRRTGRTTRVSVSSSGAQAKPAPDSFGGSAALGISADGRYVLFRSDASNLVPGDTNAKSDLFVRDRRTSRTRRIPSTGAGVFAGALSANGRFAAFDAGGNVFRYDLRHGRMVRLAAGANSWSEGAAISADGRYVSFTSNASNLVRGDTNKLPDVFVRDVAAGRTIRASVTSAGKQGIGRRYSNGANASAISGDGRYVAFHSDMRNLVRGDTNAVFDIFVHDRKTGKTQRISVSTKGRQANAESVGAPAFSADGRYVAFSSLASDLVAHDSNDITDVFVRDLRHGTTRLASLGRSGQGNDASTVGLGAAFSANDRVLVFASWAGNLVPGDTNGTADVFVREWRG